MKKGLLFTLYGLYNYGNRLQNYATYEIFKKHNVELITIKNDMHLNYNRNLMVSYAKFMLGSAKRLYYHKKRGGKYYKERTEKFKEFTTLIPTTKKYFKYNDLKKYLGYDYYIVGSDQTWTPYGSLTDLSLFKGFDSTNKISYAASLAVDELPEDKKENFKNEVLKFKKVSVREDKGKEIVESVSSRKDVEVLLDPTMLLDKTDWDKIIKKPEQKFNKNYILCYFLGDMQKSLKDKINKISKENDWQIINILDKDEPLNNSGPREFVYLEKNAKLVITDSFHSAIFAIIYNVPFIVSVHGKRQIMASRLETLLNKFKLNDRFYKDGSKIDLLKCDFTNANKILKEEQKKSNKFIEDALK